MNDDERHFSPAARYGCLRHSPGDRWRDSETGQEHWRGRVGVRTLLDAGASLDEPGDVRLPHYVEIGPYQPPSGRWKVSISRKRLDVREGDGIIKFVSTRSAVESEVFAELEDAVGYACESVEAFAAADVKDAREWWEERKEARESNDEETDTEQETLTTDGGETAGPYDTDTDHPGGDA